MTCCRAAAVLALVAIGCSPAVHPAPAAPTPAKAPATAQAPTSEPFESMVPGPAGAQHHAQRVWCSYLESLYHRATQDQSTWDQLARCNAAPSTASPEMVERTVACSQQALDGFTGNPFTGAYAAQVKRCGAEVIDSLALSTDDVAPYVTAICERASSCDGSAVADCRERVGGRLSVRLGRALGALNAESRASFQRCLKDAACEEAGEQVSGCLEPLLDRLFWTPE